MLSHLLSNQDVHTVQQDFAEIRELLMSSQILFLKQLFINLCLFQAFPGKVTNCRYRVLLATTAMPLCIYVATTKGS